MLKWLARSKSSGLIACLLAFAAAACAGADERIRHDELSWDGKTRSYRLSLPPADSPKPYPLVVALHGGLGTGDIFAKQSGFDSSANQQGFLLVYPDGVMRTWNAGRCCGPAQNQEIDDVGFIAELVKSLREEFEIDETRIFGTGFSNGAMLLQRIACERPGLFTAIAPVAGGLMRPDCAPNGPVASFYLQGLEDERIPWDGGEFKGSYRPSVAEMVNLSGQRNACSSTAVLERDDRDIVCRQLKGCPDGRAVRWCGAKGVGHQWPGGATYFPAVLGPNSQTLDATAMISRFFAEFAP